MASLDPWELILKWFEEYQPDPRAKAEYIESGLKKQQKSADTVPANRDKAVDGSLQTAACQYWVKGLPNVCSHWNSTKMVCGFSIDDETQHSHRPRWWRL